MDKNRKKINFIKKICVFIYIFITLKCFFYPSSLISDETVPNRLNFYDFYDSERFFYDSLNNFFSISENIISNKTTIYSWKNINKHSVSRIDIENSIVLTALADDNKLFLLMIQDSTLCLNFIENNLLKKAIILDSALITDYSLNRKKSCIIKVQEFGNEVFYINIGKRILKVNKNFEIISSVQNVFLIKQFFNKSTWNLTYLTDNGSVFEIHLIDTNGQQVFLGTVPATENIDLLLQKDLISVINWTNSHSSSLLTTFSLVKMSIIDSKWITSDILAVISNNSIVKEQDNDNIKNYLYCLRTEKKYFELHKIRLENNVNPYLEIVKLPDGFYSPLKLEFVENLIFIVFENGILVYDSNLSLQSFDFLDINKFSDKYFEISTYKDYVFIVSDYSTLILNNVENSLWLFKRYVYNTYKLAIPITLTLISLMFYRKYRNQKRLLDSVLKLQNAGFIFFINKTGKLITTNENGKEMLNITDNISLKKQFSFYCNTEHAQCLADLSDIGLSKRIHITQKINIVNNGIPMEWLCSLIPLRNITGRFKGILITGVDITKELERQILTNWAQLAHDMQTNLSTIRLNAEQIETDSELDTKRKDKILHQVNILVHRIKDIITVGRSDKLEKTTVNSVEFCNEIKEEFDDNIFSKIHFEMEISDFNFICDRAKLLRAVRNAIENSIKYMKGKGGTITISASKDIHNITISIKDTGIGMDEETKNKILMPFFSTARNTGGSGIGTMIMQRVAELHGGKLIINSKLNEGTEIKFQIPDISRKKIPTFKIEKHNS